MVRVTMLILLIWTGVFAISLFVRLYKTENNSSTYSSLSRPSITKRFRILYYNVPNFIRYRKDAFSCGFENCKWNNCKMTFDQTLAKESDAVIYNGLNMPYDLPFKRPNGQVWIFSTHEAPSRLYLLGQKWWYSRNYLFNWTMTYNRNSSDIYLPYGAIMKRPKNITRNMIAIARGKPNSSLIITSNCNTQSKRMEYVKELDKYIDVKILGKCSSKPWNCGFHYQHNDKCFKVVNSYRFFLAFENSFCHQYFTEKYFENFNYDTIMVTRGGLPGDAKQIFPRDTFISSDDFKSAKDLALYLKGLSFSDYARMLRKKEHYFSIGFKRVYQAALCNICYKMNFQNKYRKTIHDIKNWVQADKYCITPSKVDDIE